MRYNCSQKNILLRQIILISPVIFDIHIRHTFSLSSFIFTRTSSLSNIVRSTSAIVRVERYLRIAEGITISHIIAIRMHVAQTLWKIAFRKTSKSIAPVNAYKDTYRKRSSAPHASRSLCKEREREENRCKTIPSGNCDGEWFSISVICKELRQNT